MNYCVISRVNKYAYRDEGEFEDLRIQGARGTKFQAVAAADTDSRRFAVDLGIGEIFESFSD
jgi:hypothetical protein